jgi:hypothetical protein
MVLSPAGTRIRAASVMRRNPLFTAGDGYKMQGKNSRPVSVYAGFGTEADVNHAGTFADAGESASRSAIPEHSLITSDSPPPVAPPRHHQHHMREQDDGHHPGTLAMRRANSRGSFGLHSTVPPAIIISKQHDASTPAVPRTPEQPASQFEAWDARNTGYESPSQMISGPVGRALSSPPPLLSPVGAFNLTYETPIRMMSGDALRSPLRMISGEIGRSPSSSPVRSPQLLSGEMLLSPPKMFSGSIIPQVAGTGSTTNQMHHGNISQASSLRSASVGVDNQRRTVHARPISVYNGFGDDIPTHEWTLSPSNHAIV